MLQPPPSLVPVDDSAEGESLSLSLCVASVCDAEVKSSLAVLPTSSSGRVPISSVASFSAFEALPASASLTSESGSGGLLSPVESVVEASLHDVLPAASVAQTCQEIIPLV